MQIAPLRSTPRRARMARAQRAALRCAADRGICRPAHASDLVASGRSRRQARPWARLPADARTTATAATAGTPTYAKAMSAIARAPYAKTCSSDPGSASDTIGAIASGAAGQRALRPAVRACRGVEGGARSDGRGSWPPTPGRRKAHGTRIVRALRRYGQRHFFTIFLAMILPVEMAFTTTDSLFPTLTFSVICTTSRL